MKVQQGVIEKLTSEMSAKDRLIDEVLQAGGMVLDMLSDSTEAERAQIATIFKDLQGDLPSANVTDSDWRAIVNVIRYIYRSVV